MKMKKASAARKTCNWCFLFKA